MDHVIALFVLSLFGAMMPPSVSRVALDGGPHVSRFDGDRSLYMTTGVAATTSRGLHLGVYYARRGYDASTCVIDPAKIPQSSIVDVGRGGESMMDLGRGRGSMTIPPCFGHIRRFHRRLNYLDVKLLWRRDIVTIGRGVLHLSAGGVIGSARNCREESRDEWPAGECHVHDRDFMGGLVAGAGMDVHMSDRFYFTLGVEYGHELGVTSTQIPSPPFSIEYRTKSLLAGFAYRRR